MQPQYYVVTGVIGALTKSAASPTVNWWQQKECLCIHAMQTTSQLAKSASKTPSSPQ